MGKESSSESARNDCVRVLFVCMGNICRSPTAEGVFKHLVAEAGLDEKIVSDSAGTHDYHVGCAPDDRAQSAARRRGYELGALRARQVRREDFSRFDYVVAMDAHNRDVLLASAPPQYRNRVRLFTSFGDGPARDIPDPYYGGAQGFERVLDMVENAAQGLLRRIREEMS